MFNKYKSFIWQLMDIIIHIHVYMIQVKGLFCASAGNSSDNSFINQNFLIFKVVDKPLCKPMCFKWWGCMCQNPTLDQLSLCTPGRLSDVAPWPVPPALGADSPDPEARLSLPSLPPHSLILLLILIQPGVPFALYGLLDCTTATAPSVPP